MHANQIKVILLLLASMLANFSYAAISEEQRSLLETLPPDQRASILTKMESAESLETELEDVFENKPIVEHEDFIDGVLKIWRNNNFNELLYLEKDLRELLKYTEKSEGFDLPEISEDNYIMY